MIHYSVDIRCDSFLACDWSNGQIQNFGTSRWSRFRVYKTADLGLSGYCHQNQPSLTQNFYEPNPNQIFRILTAVLAVPLSVFWGLYFALLAFCSIWCISPCIKGFIIWVSLNRSGALVQTWDRKSVQKLISLFQTTFISKIWGLMVRTFLDPLFESFGLIFTKIQVTLRMR